MKPSILREDSITLKVNLDSEPREADSTDTTFTALDALAKTTVAEDLDFEPGAYLEVIPWAQLDRISSKALPQNIQQGFNLGTNNDSADFCYYDPSPASPMDYHIVSEEEVLQYRHEHEFYSFGHVIDGKVLFRMTPIGKGLFCSDFQHYWRLWVGIPFLEQTL